MSNPKLRWQLIFAGGPVILTFAQSLPTRDANVRIGPLACHLGVSCHFCNGFVCGCKRLQVLLHGFSVWMSHRPLPDWQAAPCSQLSELPLT